MSDRIARVVVEKETASDQHYRVVELAHRSGDQVARGDVIGAVESSKGVIDVVAQSGGFVYYFAEVGLEVEVGSLFAIVAESEQSAAALLALKDAGLPGAKKLAESETEPGGPLISKAARRLMEQHGLSSHDFAGRSLVGESDVRELMESRSTVGREPVTVSVDQSFGPNDIVVAGGGMHAKMCIDVIRRTDAFRIAGIVDPHLTPGTTVMGVAVLGPDSLLTELYARGLRLAVVGVGAFDRPLLREELFQKLLRIGFSMPNLIHPSAIIEPSAVMAEGNQIFAGAIVGSEARIGRNCILNSGAIVSHDCQLADNVHIAPGAVLAGCVSVGANSVIGMGATIFFKVSIGENVVVRNGTHVFSDLSAARARRTDIK